MLVAVQGSTFVQVGTMQAIPADPNSDIKSYSALDGAGEGSP